MDQDGTDSITASELLHALQLLSPDTKVSELVEFMGNADKDFDAHIDFDEFRSYRLQ